MKKKLALSNYYYTEMSMISEEGGAFFRPLFFDFHNETEAYLNVTNNVMLGSALKLSHQTGCNCDRTWFYFPEGTWCSVLN